MQLSVATKVCVVVPVLNDARCLALLIADLRAQPGLEIVAVDGGSEDDSLAVASAVDTVRSAPRNRGGQLQAGVAATERDWLWFLHADTRLNSPSVEALAVAMDEPGWGFFSIRLDGVSWPYRLIEAAMNWRSSATGIATGDQGIFVHRELLDTIGGVPGQALMEDVELCKRLRRVAKPRRIPVPIVTSARRWQGRGIARTVIHMWGLRLRYFLGADPEVLARCYDG